MLRDYNVLENTACNFPTEGVLFRDNYRYIYYTDDLTNFIGVWLPDPDDESNVACDIYVAPHKLNDEFFKSALAEHKGKHCYLTTEHNNLPARRLAKNYKFAKIDSSVNFICYYRLL